MINSTTLRQLVIVWCVFILACNEVNKCGLYIESAKSSFQKKDFSDAIDFMNLYLSKCTGNAEAYNMRAQSYYNLQRFENARQDFQKVVQFNKKSISAFYYLAMSFFYLEKDDSCVYYINKAINQKGNDSLYIDYTSPLGFEDIKMMQLRYNRGAALYQMDKYDEALDDFNFAISGNYKTEDCYTYIGLIALAKGNLTLACKYLKKAVGLGNKHALQYMPKECNN